MKMQILFLAANPVETPRLQLDEEARAIQEEVLRANPFAQLELVPRLAARPEDLLRALRDVRPAIVHFAGHAEAEGICFVGNDGRAAQVELAALRATFVAAGKPVCLVLLNGCSTEALASALSEVVPVCIGTSAPICDDAARAFGAFFYGALAKGEPVAQACRYGQAAMLLARGNGKTAHLSHRRDIDPATWTIGDAVRCGPTVQSNYVAFERPVAAASVVSPAAATKGAASTSSAYVAAARAPGQTSEPQTNRTEDTSEQPSLAAEAVSRPAGLRGAQLAALEGYRRRKAAGLARSAGPLAMAGNRPAEIALDDMYIPLRFDAELDPDELDRGAPIAPEQLHQPGLRYVIVGPAGSGKTTWMRWTFRRLIRLSGEPRVLPFFLELREIAARAEPAEVTARPFEAHLVNELAACAVPAPAPVVAALLADPAGPQPVILLDGWDELGALGEGLRRRLVEFCTAFPRVAVVVSSRPYGESRPAGVEAFETLYVQPLADGDVQLLAMNFHRRARGLDEPAEQRETASFMAALAAAPDARGLARTALLLTMMLMLSHQGPLPDRRHKLYTACLRNMLLRWVDQREQAGAALPRDQWRPSDSEERLRAVAVLAYRMQTEGRGILRRAPIIRSWDAAARLLDEQWTADQRDRFLRWLVASAGILADDTDGSVYFTHLSFQEHLAAYYLYVAHEDDAHLATVRSHMGNPGWWETLRLWAGLIGDRWPDKLSQVLDMLRADGIGYWLAGMIFADGGGHAADFEGWVAGLAAWLSDPFIDVIGGNECARAWQVCRQHGRRSAIAERLQQVHSDLDWMEGAWHFMWCETATLRVDPVPSLQTLWKPVSTSADVARSRVLFGAVAAWPDGAELAMLRLWPSVRSRVGLRLQAAIGVGAGPREVAAMLPGLLGPTSRCRHDENQVAAELVRPFGERSDLTSLGALGQRFYRDLGQVLDQGLGPDLGRDLVRHLVQSPRPGIGSSFGEASRFVLGRTSSREELAWISLQILEYYGIYFIQEFGNDFDLYISWNSVWRMTLDFGRYLRDLRDVLTPGFYQAFGGTLGIADGSLTDAWLIKLALYELGSAAGRAAPRSVIAHGAVPGTPLLTMFRAASRASFSPGDETLLADAKRACDAFDGDPLWPALARHVARLSTTEDRALLEELARSPEQRPAPLSWGLQFYVRGDLMLADGSVATLDELCTQAGLPPPPLLEAMPDEIDISIDDDRVDDDDGNRGS